MSYVVCRYGTQSHIGQCESYNKSIGCCEPTGEPCDATRYVRADVALRHARSEARKAYNLGYGKRDRDGFLRQTTKFEKAVEEAQQAAQQIERESAKLPEGKHCHDCMYFDRCVVLFSVRDISNDTICDWFPSRFQNKAQQASQVNK